MLRVPNSCQTAYRSSRSHQPTSARSRAFSNRAFTLPRRFPVSTFTRPLAPSTTAPADSFNARKQAAFTSVGSSSRRWRSSGMPSIVTVMPLLRAPARG
jgi:hypothetical protein